MDNRSDFKKAFVQQIISGSHGNRFLSVIVQGIVTKSASGYQVNDGTGSLQLDLDSDTFKIVLGTVVMISIMSSAISPHLEACLLTYLLNYYESLSYR